MSWTSIIQGVARHPAGGERSIGMIINGLCVVSLVVSTLLQKTEGKTGAPVARVTEAHIQGQSKDTYTIAGKETRATERLRRIHHRSVLRSQENAADCFLPPL